MPDIQYPQRPYPGQNTGQNFNTGMAQQQTPQQQQYYQQPYGQIPAQAQLTPEQQQQAQTIQTPEIQREDYRAKINLKSRTSVIALVILFGIVFIGAIVYFLLPKQQEVIQEKVVREEAPKTIIVSPGQELIKKDVVIDEIKFCSDIDENFYCYEEEDNTFNIGESVYVYIRVKGFSQVKREEGYLIGVREDVETLDPEGIAVYELSGTAANLADFYSEGKNYLHLKNRFRIPPELKPGVYTFKINIKDKITGKQASQEKGFWLE